eukprot:jgi/Mesen1/9687/ME000680S09094
MLARLCKSRGFCNAAKSLFPVHRYQHRTQQAGPRLARSLSATAFVKDAQMSSGRFPKGINDNDPFFTAIAILGLAGSALIGERLTTEDPRGHPIEPHHVQLEALAHEPEGVEATGGAEGRGQEGGHAVPDTDEERVSSLLSDAEVSIPEEQAEQPQGGAEVPHGDAGAAIFSGASVSGSDDPAASKAAAAGGGGDEGSSRQSGDSGEAETPLEERPSSLGAGGEAAEAHGEGHQEGALAGVGSEVRQLVLQLVEAGAAAEEAVEDFVREALGKVGKEGGGRGEGEGRRKEAQPEKSSQLEEPAPQQGSGVRQLVHQLVEAGAAAEEAVEDFVREALGKAEKEGGGRGEGGGKEAQPEDSPRQEEPAPGGTGTSETGSGEWVVLDSIADGVATAAAIVKDAVDAVTGTQQPSEGDGGNGGDGGKSAGLARVLGAEADRQEGVEAGARGEATQDAQEHGEGGGEGGEGEEAAHVEVAGETAAAAAGATTPAAEVEEEEAECPFCAFMKAGPCGKQFTEWEDCVDAAEKDSDSIVSRCVAMTHELSVCMKANPEYYGPVLEAEKGMAEAEEESETADASAETSAGTSADASAGASDGIGSGSQQADSPPVSGEGEAGSVSGHQVDGGSLGSLRQDGSASQSNLEGEESRGRESIPEVTSELPATTLLATSHNESTGSEGQERS